MRGAGDARRVGYAGEGVGVGVGVADREIDRRFPRAKVGIGLAIDNVTCTCTA